MQSISLIPIKAYVFGKQIRRRQRNKIQLAELLVPTESCDDDHIADDLTVRICTVGPA